VVKVHQNASVHVASLDAGAQIQHSQGAGRGAYVYIIDGGVLLDTEELLSGDAAKVSQQSELVIQARVLSELILVHVPMQFRAVGIWRDHI
jgi:quercetin 2,3-dioxygenase